MQTELLSNSSAIYTNTFVDYHLSTDSKLDDYPIMSLIVSMVQENAPYRLFNYKLLKNGIRTNPNPNELVISKFHYDDPYFMPTIVSMIKTEVFLNKKFTILDKLVSYKSFVEEEYYNYVDKIVDAFFFNINYFITKDKEFDLERHYILVTRNPEVFPDLDQVMFIYEAIRTMANTFITPKLVHIQSSQVGAISLLFRVDPTEKLAYDTVYYLTRYGSITEKDFLRRALKSYKAITSSRKRKKESEELDIVEQ